MQTATKILMMKYKINSRLRSGLDGSLCATRKVPQQSSEKDRKGTFWNSQQQRTHCEYEKQKLKERQLRDERAGVRRVDWFFRLQFREL